MRHAKGLCRDDGKPETIRHFRAYIEINAGGAMGKPRIHIATYNSDGCRVRGSC